MSDIALRPARPDEANALTRLMVRAKTSHGYDDQTMAIFAPALVVSEAHITRNWVLIAERPSVMSCAERRRDISSVPDPFDDTDPLDAPALLGFAHVERRDDPAIAWLEDLFVDPDAQGQGVGTLLWHAALDHARVLGATELRFDADPNATAFYVRLGATVIGATASTLIPGRAMPLMSYPITHRSLGDHPVDVETSF